MKRRKGFTLMELLIVVIIIGILASLALPQFLKATEKAKAAEAANILGALRGAQMRNNLQHDTYETDCDNLDTGWSTPQHFNAPTCANNANSLVSMVRGAGATYTLTIDENGEISCAGDDCSDAGY